MRESTHLIRVHRSTKDKLDIFRKETTSYDSAIRGVLHDLDYILILRSFIKAYEHRDSPYVLDDLTKLRDLVDKIIQKEIKPYKPIPANEYELDGLLEKLRESTKDDDKVIDDFLKKHADD